MITRPVLCIVVFRSCKRYHRSLVLLSKLLNGWYANMVVDENVSVVGSNEDGGCLLVRGGGYG